MGGLEQVVSVVTGVVCLGIAAVLWLVVRDSVRPAQAKAWLDRGITLLVLAGTVGIAGTKLGGWIRTGVGWATSHLGQFIGSLTGTAVVFLAAVFVFVVVVVHLVTAKVGRGTLAAAVVSPLTVASIPGPFGAAALTAMSVVAGAVGAGVAGLFGLR